MGDQAINWEGVEEAVARQIAHQGETFLQAQLTVALAADQRAVTAASVFATFATALLAATLAYWEKFHDLPILLAGLSASAAMCVGAFYGFWSARPVDMYFPGNHPKQWWPCRETGLAETMGAESENYQARIEFNERCMSENARAFSRSARIASAAPVLAVLVWGVAELISYPLL